MLIIVSYVAFCSNVNGVFVLEGKQLIVYGLLLEQMLVKQTYDNNIKINELTGIENSSGLHNCHEVLNTFTVRLL